ncbi:MAG: hypothetical protein QY331_06380 [Melioribacteraceae bacterium]|nr:MAG: hypothetical protein QY331_06380 [Melioribacteraceae bacterium]
MKKRRRRIVNIPKEYIEAIDIAEPVFSHFFQFENGLRIALNDFMVVCYGNDWWEKSLKIRKRDIYDYVAKVKQKQTYMPWIGDSARVPILPIHSITLGQLAEIVKEYKSDCIPQLFPNWEFFSGHLEIIKRVRNLYAHMYPCITKKDIRVAKRDILTLCDHLNSKLN